VNVDGSAIRVDLVYANTSLVREKIHAYSPLFRKGKKDVVEIAPLSFHLGNTLSRHDTPFGLYQLRIRVDAYIETDPDSKGGLYNTYEYKTPAFHIVSPASVNKPDSARQKELLEGGGKRSRFS